MFSLFRKYLLLTGVLLIFKMLQASPVFLTAPTTCPNNKTFCTDVNTHPKQYMYHLIQKGLVNPKDFHDEDTLNIARRFYENKVFYELCAVDRMTHFPEMAQNEKGENKYIFNLAKYRQAITVEECRGAGKSCTSLFGVQQQHSTCVQKYQTVLLLAVGSDGQPFWDSFRLPSHCVCSLQESRVKTRIQSPKIILDDLDKDVMFPTSEEDEDDIRLQDVSSMEDDEDDYRTDLFREVVENYPDLFLREALRNSRYIWNYFKIPHILDPDDPDDVGTVIDDGCLCPTKSFLIYPKAGYNLKQEYKLIYNIEDYKQGVVLTYCVAETTCNYYNGSRKYQTQCTQAYAEQRLLAIDKNKTDPYMDVFLFYSGCKCTYRYKSAYFGFKKQDQR